MLEFRRFVVLAIAAAAAVSTHAEPPVGPYAGEQARSVKALSESDVAGLLSGNGAGFAKAAELNGYPGPAHVLELAGALQLNAEQAAATRNLMTAHKARAQSLGAEVVAAERDLDQLFADKRADPLAVDQATQRVGLLQARLRAEHLKTHLSQTALLAPEQVLRYAVLRGYASAPGAGHNHSHADAIGVPGKAGKVDRTVNVDMTDAMRFIPASIAVKQGETVRFVIKNSGQLKHEFVLGTEKELEEHYELMKKFPEMEHSDPNQVTVVAGKTGEVIWRFTRAGKVDFACLQPGHYDAGMKGVVNVAAGKGAATKADGHVGHKH